MPPYFLNLPKVTEWMRFFIGGKTPRELHGASWTAMTDYGGDTLRDSGYPLTFGETRSFPTLAEPRWADTAKLPLSALGWERSPTYAEMLSIVHPFWLANWNLSCREVLPREQALWFLPPSGPYDIRPQYEDQPRDYSNLPSEVPGPTDRSSTELWVPTWPEEGAGLTSVRGWHICFSLGHFGHIAHSGDEPRWQRTLAAYDLAARSNQVRWTKGTLLLFELIPWKKFISEHAPRWTQPPLHERP